jgi:hypothetical protein
MLDLNQAKFMDSKAGSLILGFGGWACGMLATMCLGCCSADGGDAPVEEGFKVIFLSQSPMPYAICHMPYIC